MVWSTIVSAVTNMNFFFAKCSIYACLPPFQTISTGLLTSSNSWLPIHLILTLSPILLGSLMVYVMTFVVLFWLLVLRTSILRALWPCCRRRRVIKVGAGNSVHRKGPCSPRRRPSRGHFLFRPLLRVHFPIPRLPIVAWLTTPSPAALHWTIASPLFAIIAELVASAFDAVRSGLRVTNAPLSLSYMSSKRSGTFVKLNLRRPILQKTLQSLFHLSSF
jgi:hypothetical protein